MILPYAIIENNKIINIINIDDNEVELIAALKAIPIPADCNTGIGCSYVDGVFEEAVYPTEQVIESTVDLSFEDIEALIERIVNENNS